MRHFWDAEFLYVGSWMMAQKNIHGRNQGRRRIWIGLIVLLLLFAAAAAWKWTPLADLIDVHRLAVWAGSLRQSPARHFYILSAYLIGSVLLVPITVLILLTGMVFGPLLGSLYSLAGCLVASGVTYAIGHFLGQDFVRKIAGAKWQRLQRKMDKSGILAVAILRLLPVAPFTVVNIVSGAFKVPLRDYILGSLLGLMPGILVINLFAHQFETAIRDPGIGTFLILAAVVAVTIIGTAWLKRRFDGA
ncbi:MAG TPA: TVP38/TMEM64 family protein [Candidatus Binatia bacterium]